jgi:hypothetical protein
MLRARLAAEKEAVRLRNPALAAVLDIKVDDAEARSR